MAADGQVMLYLSAQYADGIVEEAVRPSGPHDLCGIRIGGKFLEVSWPSPKVAVLHLEGQQVEIPQGTSTHITFVGVPIDADHE